MDKNSKSECFPGVEIKGGVSYSKWSSAYSGKCKYVVHKNNKIESEEKRFLFINGMDTVIRYNGALPIVEKVRKFKEPSFSEIVSPIKPFGLPTKYIGLKESDVSKAIKEVRSKR